MSTQIEETAKALAKLMQDPDSNGVEAEARQKRKPRFDGTVNLGHVLTILTMGVALATMFVNSRVTEADHESRIRQLEEVSREFKSTLSKMAETEAQGMRNQDKIANALEWLTKDRAKKP